MFGKYSVPLIVYVIISCHAPSTKNIAQQDSSRLIVHHQDTMVWVDLMSGPVINVATQSFEEELREKTPGFTMANCIKYDPEQLYEILRKKTATLFRQDGIISFSYSSEAGIDEFYIDYARMLKKYNDSLSSSDDSLRVPLRRLLIEANKAFHCIADGGTSYYHNSNRIPAYVEWYLLQNKKKANPVQKAMTLEKLKQAILQIGISYSAGKPANRKELEVAVQHCIDREVEDQPYTAFTLNKAYQFIKHHY